ncbi:MAG: hypothetical protein AB1609_20445 [Bacillota bacterium]
MARTTGGLIKRNYQFTDEQIARITQVARERGVKEAAAVRELLDLGYQVYERLKPATEATRDLAVELVARKAS